MTFPIRELNQERKHVFVLPRGIQQLHFEPFLLKNQYF